MRGKLGGLPSGPLRFARVGAICALPRAARGVLFSRPAIGSFLSVAGGWALRACGRAGGWAPWAFVAAPLGGGAARPSGFALRALSGRFFPPPSPFLPPGLRSARAPRPRARVGVSLGSSHRGRGSRAAAKLRGRGSAARGPSRSRSAPLRRAAPGGPLPLSIAAALGPPFAGSAGRAGVLPPFRCGLRFAPPSARDASPSGLALSRCGGSAAKGEPLGPPGTPPHPGSGAADAFDKCSITRQRVDI